MPDLIRFSDLKNSQPLTLDGANDLFAIAVKNESSETGYTSMTVKPNMIAGYVAEDATYANLKTGSTDGDNTIVKAINKTLGNFADEFNTTEGSTYAKDDCVLYNGVLYQCSNISGTTSGTFIPADWTQIKSVDVGSGGGGGSSGDHITLTQAEYNALVQAGTVDPDAYYFISDATLPSYAHNYSTTEQVVGTWVDGSPVYEKTFVVNNPSTGNNTITHNISNLDMLISVSGFAKRTDGYQQMFNFITNADDFKWNLLVLDFSSTDFVLSVGVNYTDTKAISKAVVTLRYTKSTS